MRAAEVVVYEVQGNLGPLLFERIAEGIRQAGDAAGAHPNDDVRPLDLADRNVRGVGAVVDLVHGRSGEARRAVANLRSCRRRIAVLG